MESNSPADAWLFLAYVYLLAKVSEYSFNLAYNRHILGDDWLHIVILRLKSDVIGFLVEPFYCRIRLGSVIYEGYYNLTV